MGIPFADYRVCTSWPTPSEDEASCEHSGPTFNPIVARLSPEDSVLLPVAKLPSYLYRELGKLGLVRFSMEQGADRSTQVPGRTS